MLIDYKITHAHMCYDHHACLVPAAGAGWTDLIAEMMVELDDARRYQKEPLLIENIRDENGALRVLTHWCCPEIEAILDKYSELSYETCTKCGSQGDRDHTGFWAMKGQCRACLAQ